MSHKESESGDEERNIATSTPTAKRQRLMLSGPPVVVELCGQSGTASISTTSTALSTNKRYYAALPTDELLEETLKFLSRLELCTIHLVNCRFQRIMDSCEMRNNGPRYVFSKLELSEFTPDAWQVLAEGAASNAISKGNFQGSYEEYFKSFTKSDKVAAIPTNELMLTLEGEFLLLPPQYRCDPLAEDLRQWLYASRNGSFDCTAVECWSNKNPSPTVAWLLDEVITRPSTLSIYGFGFPQLPRGLLSSHCRTLTIDATPSKFRQAVNVELLVEWLHQCPSISRGDRSVDSNSDPTPKLLTLVVDDDNLPYAEELIMRVKQAFETDRGVNGPTPPFVVSIDVYATDYSHF